MSLWTEFRDSAEQSVGLGNGAPSAEALAQQAGAALAGSAIAAGNAALNPPSVNTTHPATSSISAGVAAVKKSLPFSLPVMIGVAVVAYFLLKGRK